MHKVIFKKISIENFLSIGNVEFDFEKHNGLNYIFGINKDVNGTKNGSGKSSIFIDSILFALFGKTAKAINNAYITNRQCVKTCCNVFLDLDINNHIYNLESGINQYGTSFFRLFKDNIDITKSSVKETRRYFEKEILKSNFDMFKNSVLLSANDSQKFFSMSKSIKREFIENIFNLSVFGKMLKDIRNDTNVIEREILSLQSSIKEKTVSLEKFKKEEEIFEQDKSSSVDDINVKIKNKKERLAELNTELKESTSKLVQLKKELKKYEDNNEKINDLKENKVKINSLLKVKQNGIKQNTEIIEKHKEVLEEICKDCNDKLKNKLNINNAENNIIDFESKIVQYKKVLTKIDDRQIKLNKKKKLKEKIEKSINIINNQITENKWIIDHLKSDIKKLSKDIKNASNKVCPFKQLIIDYMNTLESDSVTIKNLCNNKKELEVLQHVVSEDGAKKYIIKDLINILNSRVRKYLDEMGSLFTCMFDCSLSCEFLTETGMTSYENFSCGEKARIDIAVIFAFRDILSSIGTLNSSFIVLDEFIDNGLDNYAVNSLIKILKNINSETDKTIFLISHRSEIDESDFDNIIEIEKNNGFTKIISDPMGE